MPVATPHHVSTTSGPPADAHRAMIAAEGLTKVYPSGVRSVDDVSLSVAAGEVYGFLGPNGAGKTTTIKMMLGLVTPTAGRVWLNGYDAHRQRAGAVRQVGTVLEGARNVYWQLSAWHNLLYFGRLKGLPSREVRPRARWLLEQLDLWDRRGEPVGEYSRGMQQKVAVAVALIADPPILLLDEPTLGLDVDAARTIRGWIRDLAETHGKTIVLTSHQLSLVQELAHRVGVIRDGRLIADLATDQLLARFRHGDRYELVVDGEHPDLALPDSFTAHPDNGTTVIAGTIDNAESLYQLIGRMHRDGLMLRSVGQPQPDLEEIFVHLVHDRSIHHG